MDIGYIAIGAALCLLSCAAAGLGMGLATGKAVEAVARQPEASGKIAAGPGSDGIDGNLRVCQRADHDVHTRCIGKKRRQKWSFIHWISSSILSILL